MLDMFIGGFRAPDYGHFKGICMSVALWIVLLVCVLWIALSEMPAGWVRAHLPLPYLIALTPLLWIPTLAIAIAGVVRHDTALAIVAAIACIASLLRKSRIGTQSHVHQHGADGGRQHRKKCVKHPVEHIRRLPRKPRNTAVSA